MYLPDGDVASVSSVFTLEFEADELVSECSREGEVDFVAALLGIVLIRFTAGATSPIGEASNFWAVAFPGVSSDSDGISGPCSSRSE